MSALSRRAFLRNTGLAAAGVSLTGLTSAQGVAANVLAPLASTGPVYLNYNECPLGPSAAAQAAVREILPHSGRYHFGLRYELAAELAKQYGVPVDHIAIYPGSSDPLDRSAWAFSGPDRSVVMPNPTFDALAGTAADAGATVHRTDLLADGSHDVEALATRDPRAGIVYVCNPNNPTGTVTAYSRLRWLLDNKPADSLLLVDEAYIDYTDETSLVPLVAERADLLILRTFSKIYGMAGLRLGVAVAQPAILKKLAAYGVSPLPATAAVAGLASLREPELVPTRRRENAGVRDETMAWLRARGHACTASQTNFFMFKVNGDGAAFSKAMAAKGVVIGKAWPIWPNYVRVSVGTADEMSRFREVFAQVAS